MGIGWVHRPRPAPHLHGCLHPGAAHREIGSAWVCSTCETLWIVRSKQPPFGKYWALANWWQRWRYWNWGEGRTT